jgi:predicted ester cyclase
MEVMVSVEQVARNFITMMNDAEKMKTSVTADAMASGGVLPQPIPVMQAFDMMKGLAAAFPDLKFDVESVTVNGDQATVNVRWGGTQTGEFNMGIPGIPAIPATGKKVSVKDAYVVTVRGDKVSHMQVTSPADGGMPAAFAQMGVQMPSM